jgi:hypothetical protein
MCRKSAHKQRVLFLGCFFVLLFLALWCVPAQSQQTLFPGGPPDFPQSAHLDLGALFGQSNQEDRAQDAAPDKYHWRGLLLQSLAFNVIENGVRVAADHNMRDQLAHKPFWRDYANSLDHFNMNRWNDGDDFLVNEIGHSMQGAISADIAIQNSPTGSRTRWGDAGYARSRFYGFLWAVAFSTHSEISPIGEAGIGNEGGFTYGLNCLAKCTAENFAPGDKYTNNTGWTDFVITPLGGMLIVVAEDVVDKKISDRIVNALPNHVLLGQILRGTLNPARSWTNLLRGKVPWYRDWQSPWPEATRGVHFVRSDEELAANQHPRYEISPHFSAFSVPVNTQACAGCRKVVTGSGVEVSMRLLRWLDASADIGVQPGASPLPSDRAGGTMVNGFFGLRSGIQTKNYAVRLAVRPGFLRYDRAYQQSPTTTVIYPRYPGTTVNAEIGPTTVNASPPIGPITHFAWNVSLSADYGLGRAFALRAAIEENLVRYRTSYVDPPNPGSPPYLSYLSRENFTNRGSWAYQFGPVFRF